MKKRLTLLILALLPYFWVSAQELPRSIYVGSINVKMEGDARAIIEREIDNLNANQKYLSTLVNKMNLYFPIIEKILAEEGIPDEFKYLCVQESAFNPDAVSSSNAIGYWQFKRETAQEVGLRVDGVVDERKHIAAATKGAAVYLSRNNLILKNWISTLLSYRLGLGAVRRMSDNDWAYKNEVTVNASTDWYVLRFLAYRYFLEKQYKQSKNQGNTSQLFEYTNSRGKNLRDIAEELDVPFADLMTNNAWLKTTTVPDDKDYTVYLPVNRQQYSDLKAKIAPPKSSDEQVTVNRDLGFPVLIKLTEIATPDEPIFYEINGKKGILARQGDTPESIAERAGINLKRFLKYNDLEETDRIIPNEVYYLRKKDHRAEVAYHTVEGYETLWKISQMYGIMLEDLMEKNRITQIQRLQKGRILWLMEARSDDQGFEYIKTNDDTKTTVSIEDKPFTSETKKQPINIQPSTKKQSIPQNTTSEVTIVETIVESETKPNKSVIKDNNTGTKSDVTTVTVKQLPSGVSMTPSVVYPAEKSNKIIKSHIVEPKQTLFSISRLYGMSIDELYNLNDMYSGSPLRIGQEIKVYQPSTSPMTGATKSEDKTTTYSYPSKTNSNPSVTSTTTVIREVVTTPSENLEVASAAPSPITAATSSKSFTTTNSKPNYKIIHTIQAGETIYRVSKIYGVSVENIKAWNNLTGNTVEVGQELMVLGGNVIPDYSATIKSNATPYNASNNYQYHILKAGETVFRVSQIYGVSVDDIVKWNNIKNYSVMVGQKLVIKK